MQLMIPLIYVSFKITEINKILKKNYPDGLIIKLTPEKTEYSINQIRSIMKEIVLYQSQIRIYLFETFEKSSIETQNSLLKTLEEPPTNIQFVLSVSNEYQIIPTILSRSKIVKKAVSPPNLTDEKVASNNLDLRKLEDTLSHTDFNVTNKDEALIQIDHLISQVKTAKEYRERSFKIIKECIKLRRLIDNNNINPQLGIDHLLIFISKIYSIKK